MRLDPAAVRAQIESLLVSFPELQDDEILRADMLEGSTDLVEFLRRLETARQQATATAAAIDTLIDNWRQRQSRFDRRDQAIRDLMMKLLQTAHLKRMELPEATLSVRLGVPKVIITDEAAVPDELCRFKREPNKTKIKDELSQFKPVPGATLSNAEDGLTIRVK
jgi:hypothetical protein